MIFNGPCTLSVSWLTIYDSNCSSFYNRGRQNRYICTRTVISRIRAFLTEDQINLKLAGGLCIRPKTTTAQVIVLVTLFLLKFFVVKKSKFYTGSFVR